MPLQRDISKAKTFENSHWKFAAQYLKRRGKSTNIDWHVSGRRYALQETYGHLEHHVESRAKLPLHFGHAILSFATAAKFRTCFDEFDEKIGAENLKILHLNDAKAPCGSKLDRHEHLGLGQIGTLGIKAAVKYAAKRDIPTILETPIDSVRDAQGDLDEARNLAK